MVAASYPDGITITFVYDGNGNKLSMTDQNGTANYTYDSKNRVISSTDSFGKQLQYQYDAVGNLIRLTYPDGKQVNYTYDEANFPSTVTDWDNNTTQYYYSGGRLDSIAFPNSLTETRAYDGAGRLIQIATADTLLSITLLRDAMGNPVSITESGTLAPVIPSKVVEYEYDTDNRLDFTSDGYYGYDNNGNLISRHLIGDTVSFAYNSRNLLISQQKGSHLVEHVYDGNDNRIARIENGVQKRYVLDLHGPMSHVLCETDASGNITAYYIYGLQLLAKAEPGEGRYYYHTNELSTVLALSNEAGDITDRYAYSPFGALCAQEGNTENPFTYIGGLGVMAENDGLYFMRARFYDPERGRFLGKDPLEGSLYLPLGLNLFAYVTNNPLLWTDPSGLCPNIGLSRSSFKTINTKQSPSLKHLHSSITQNSNNYPSSTAPYDFNLDLVQLNSKTVNKSTGNTPINSESMLQALMLLWAGAIGADFILMATGVTSPIWLTVLAVIGPADILGTGDFEWQYYEEEIYGPPVDLRPQIYSGSMMSGSAVPRVTHWNPYLLPARSSGF